MANTNALSSGHGTRATTDGGVDNIGAHGPDRVNAKHSESGAALGKPRPVVIQAPGH